ncbi:glycosyltransferase family 2 protein [Dechloromonas sp. HYN0024]|uniref:glycosyltransferase family 2 protein n=1 Tax=Dechloromonas sp. HYN0024 TaxID=2231055 RepID=UPI000E436C0E|nr:glycosyltransferase family 2 protein [Dechloromonas sp. HYN0024]AXS78706.1 glycosyltransferase family 2 protein [Dechloromonas sp. HYN0024]
MKHSGGNRGAVRNEKAGMKLSVVVITKNEAHCIGDCLRSVSFADEVIVLDSGSSDKTVEICRGLGARVEVTDWPGFGPQKNRALDFARGNWVLSLDADEAVTDALREEILQVMEAGVSNVYMMPRLSSYLGRPMRHSGWWPDYVARLFRRGSARFSPDLVHEKLVFSERPGHLRAHLEHEAFTSLEEVIDKMNRYSSAGAEMARQKGRGSSLGLAVLKGLVAFLRTYVIRAGFLDGREGFMLAVSNAEGTYYRQVKLMLLNDRQR